LVQYFERTPNLYNLPFLQKNPFLCHFQNLFRLMRDVKKRKRKLSINPGEIGENPLFQRKIKAGKRFIQKKKCRLGAERPSNRNATTLSAGERKGFSRQKRREFQNRDDFIEPPLSSVLQILPNGEMGKKRVSLRNKPDSSLMGRQRCQFLSSKNEFSRREKPRNRLQKGGFPTSRNPANCGHRPL